MKLHTLIAILFATTLTSAFANEPTVTCPTVDLVTNASAAMDDALPDDRSYIVSSKPVINFENRQWSARTTIRARSQEDAIKLARVVVKEVSSLMTPTAVKVFKQYGCTYFSPRAFVYTFTPATEGGRLG